MFKEIEIEHFTSIAYAIPLKVGGFAFLSACSISSPYITREERWYNTTWDYWGGHEKMNKFLNQIKSGIWNQIISPQKDSTNIKWEELDYSNARILERESKVTSTYAYKGT